MHRWSRLRRAASSRNSLGRAGRVPSWGVLLSLAACAPGDDDPARPEPRVAWVYPPPTSGFPYGEPRGRLGRSLAPQPLTELGIAAGDGELAGVRRPLHQASAWPIPGAGPARAVVYGVDGDQPAIELIELDPERGRIAWRDTVACAAPIVGITADAIVCTDVAGTRAVGLDGKPRWSVAQAFLAFTGDRVVVRAGDGVAVLDAASGGELAHVALPRGVAAETVIASCGDAGRELLAATPDGKLVAIAEAAGGPAVRWTAALGVIRGVDVGATDDGCDPTVIAAVQAPTGLALVALARATGKQIGRIDGVLGRWPARTGDGLEVSTARGVARVSRELASPAALALPPLGELIARRGDRRLVRATPWTAVLLDAAGVRGYLPFAAIDGVLGDTALLATSWAGSPGETVHRFALPPAWRGRLRLPARHPGTAVDAELRDLPEPRALGAGFALADTGARGVGGYALDPGDGAALYAIALDHGAGAAVARADLAARRWRWQRVDGCGPGEPVALAVARDVVVCATRGAPALVRATSRDGVPRWDHAAGNVDAVTAGGDLVIVHDADRLTLLDAGDGSVRGRLASGDTGPARAAIVALPEATLVIAAERGRIVARLSRGLWPVWSVAVAGVVRQLAAAGDGVVAVLDDGDAYRLDARSAEITALPGLGLGWRVDGDVLAGHTRGGPVPAPAPPPPPPTAAQLLRRPLQVIRIEITTPPPMSTPIAPPPPLGDSWQLALYEPAGGLRARNDYAFPPPVAPPAPRGPAGSPIVVAYGAGEVCVLDPRTGDPLRRVRLPDGAAPGAVFGTIVDGSPVAGVVLGSPLRVVQF